MLPRYVVIGGGAIGVTMAAELHRSGSPVTLVTRGAQLEAARQTGITYVRPDAARILTVDVAGDPDEVELTESDILVLATKTQDAAAAVEVWAEQPVKLDSGAVARAGAVLPLLTTQNGLETERLALRYFATVIGGVLILGATYVKPGLVVATGFPAVGLTWIGAYPDRALSRVDAIARDLRRANIDTETVADISAWKRAKLLFSITFVLDALYEPSPLRDRAAALLQQEAREVFASSGQSVAELAQAMASAPRKPGNKEIPGYERGGTSTWQSLTRSGSLETDYLNGEIVLQARLAGRTAPANEAITHRIHRAAREGSAPRSLGEDDLLATLPQLREHETHGSEVLIDALSLNTARTGGTPPAILDVRWKLGDADGRTHFSEGHIPGAAYVDLESELASEPSAAEGRHPLPDLDDLQAAARRWGLHAGQPVVVYDDNGGMSAARAWWLLRFAGVEDVRILDGALSAWKALGLPLETGEPAPQPGDVTLTEGHLPLLDAEQAAELATTGVLLDARAHERYRGEHEPVDPRAGHIPGAVSAPTSENLAPDGRFLTPEALLARFTELGVDAESEVGVYCGSGVTAAHEVAALQIAGIHASLFAGSWSAWSSDPDRPVAVGVNP
jgi:thiosulfate/3-mercaptopyruvate sulfurtransferase